MKRVKSIGTFVVIPMCMGLGCATPARAATTCSFSTDGSTLRLEADCWTDQSILVPDGFTLDGAGHTITAVDPPGGHFLGAVVRNAGATASVEHLTIVGSLVANACDAGGDRLRWILLDAASGTVAHNRVLGINQGPSGCQEGNAIETTQL